VRIYPTAGDKHKVTDGKKQSKKVSYEETKPVLQNTPYLPFGWFLSREGQFGDAQEEQHPDQSYKAKPKNKFNHKNRLIMRRANS